MAKTSTVVPRARPATGGAHGSWRHGGTGTCRRGEIAKFPSPSRCPSALACRLAVDIGTSPPLGAHQNGRFRPPGPPPGLFQGWRYTAI